MKILIPLFIVILVILFFIRSTSPPVQPSPQPAPTSVPTSSPALAEPTQDFKQRITKKFFGTYITPANSPVQPERFTGYHTGVDVEFGDVSADVPARAVTDGQVIYSGWVSGYSGFLAIQHSDFISVYSHLNPKTIPAKNSLVLRSQTIGSLGQAYTSETDNERKHLHFAIVKGNQLNLLGYVQKLSELSAWYNPSIFYP